MLITRFKRHRSIFIKNDRFFKAPARLTQLARNNYLLSLRELGL